MSNIAGVPVRPMSRVDVEIASLTYLVDQAPEVLREPLELNVDRLLTLSIPKSHQYKLDLITAFETAGIEGQMHPAQRLIQLTESSYSLMCSGNGRARFTACHEIGHVLLHHDQFLGMIQNPARMKVQKDLKAYVDPEWQADYSSSALLMPFTSVYPLWKDLSKRGAEEDEIADEFVDLYGVSRQAASIRLQKISQSDLARLAHHFGL